MDPPQGVFLIIHGYSLDLLLQKLGRVWQALLCFGDPTHAVIFPEKISQEALQSDFRYAGRNA